jgi:hypothetical protein
MKIEYPKWLYPKSGPGVIVASAEERKNLVGEFKESPADWLSEQATHAVHEAHASNGLDMIKAALKAAGFKDSQLKKKSEAELLALYAALEKKG